jgi:hypothetical protein
MLDYVFKREQHAQLHTPFVWADVERTTKIITANHHKKKKDDVIDRHEYALLELLRLDYVSDSIVKTIMDKYDSLDEKAEGHVPIAVLLESGPKGSGDEESNKGPGGSYRKAANDIDERILEEAVELRHLGKKGYAAYKHGHSFRHNIVVDSSDDADQDLENPNPNPAPALDPPQVPEPPKPQESTAVEE